MAVIRGAGTRVILTKSGYVKVIGSANPYELQEGEREISYLTAVDIRLRSDEVVTAELHVGVQEVQIDGKPQLVMKHPVTGLKKEIKTVIFKDGRTLDGSLY